MIQRQKEWNTRLRTRVRRGNRGWPRSEPQEGIYLSYTWRKHCGITHGSCEIREVGEGKRGNCAVERRENPRKVRDALERTVVGKNPRKGVPRKRETKSKSESRRRRVFGAFSGLNLGRSASSSLHRYYPKQIGESTILIRFSARILLGPGPANFPASFAYFPRSYIIAIMVHNSILAPSRDSNTSNLWENRVKEAVNELIN